MQTFGDKQRNMRIYFYITTVEGLDNYICIFLLFIGLSCPDLILFNMKNTTSKHKLNEISLILYILLLLYAIFNHPRR